MSAPVTNSDIIEFFKAPKRASMPPHLVQAVLKAYGLNSPEQRGRSFTSFLFGSPTASPNIKNTAIKSVKNDSKK